MINPHRLQQRATAALAVALSFALSSCGTIGIQPRVNNLVVANQLDQATKVLGDNPNAYGKNNQLLYWLDRGMVYQCAGHYKESIQAFANAQKKFDALYTKSLSKLASAWVLNDYWSPYQGEYYEYILVNIFQAMNYVMLGEYNEALVEARDMDSKLNVVQTLYAGKNKYKEDAFGRFLMGILYEVNGSSSDLNDAYISYDRAYEAYTHDFQDQYGIEPPELLKENLLTLAKFMGGEAWTRYRQELSTTPLITLADKKKKAEVYFVEYAGFSPVKVPQSIPIPLDPGHITQVSFPAFVARGIETGSSQFVAINFQQTSFVQPTEIGHNIETLAMKVLDEHRAAITTKAIVRPLAKYAAERAVEHQIEQNSGHDAAQAFGFFSSLYNLATEQADLRSWQTLPGQIRISRLLLDPGEYEFFIQTSNKVSVGKARLAAGEKKFFMFRNYR